MTVTTLHPVREGRPAIAPDTPVQAMGVAANSPRRDEHMRASGGGNGPPWVDLCGLDYYDRRRRLFVALRTLEPGEEVVLISDRADDVSWLRYEMEARFPQRYCWSLPQESHGTAHTTVRLPRQLE